MASEERYRLLFEGNPHPMWVYDLESGYEADAIVRDGILPQGTRYLQKPFSPGTLAHKVREVLENPTAPGGS